MTSAESVFEIYRIMCIVTILSLGKGFGAYAREMHVVAMCPIRRLIKKKKNVTRLPYESFLRLAFFFMPFKA